MVRPTHIPLVKTIGDRCRVCFTCVRKCPAKAIRIADGQAEVISERCIGCGKCVTVCSQHAKKVMDSIERVEHIFGSGKKVAAVLAPSFPAEFSEVDYHQVVGGLRKLGFDLVNEVAFGADLVAAAYRHLVYTSADKRYIATTCPSIVAFVERYHPALLPSLAPIVSPMIAVSRALKRIHGQELRVVFIGPCIAKKGEAASYEVEGEVDAALTFVELRNMLKNGGVELDKVEKSEFDPPQPGRGALFAISRGLLQAADIAEDLISAEVVAADGTKGFVESLKEFETGDLDAKLLEVLCCHGCISGAGMSQTNAPIFSRRSQVSRYVRGRLDTLDDKEYEVNLKKFEDLDLTRQFSANDQRIPLPSPENIKEILKRMGKSQPEHELNCGACGYETCWEHAVAIYKGLAESEMCLPYMIDELKKTVDELGISNDKLASAREALRQSEKLATMGQLAAGIAHEVNNPLGVVLMYAHLLIEEAESDSPINEDLKLIAEQADRCKKIVSGLLHFARRNKVQLDDTDVREMVDSVARSLQLPKNVEIIREEENLDNPLAQLDRDQIIQALTNLSTNAVTAMSKGGKLTIRIVGSDEKILISISDTGVGIPEENRAKIFEPFFTTKKMGVGTGLGLAVTYGIIKMHRGDIRLDSNCDPDAGPTGTTFTITLPRYGQPAEEMEITTVEYQ